MEIKRELDDVEAVAKVLMAARDPALDVPSPPAGATAPVRDGGTGGVAATARVPLLEPVHVPEASLR